MVWLTLMIGLLNVGLGFALAMYLGYGPPDVVAAWQAVWNPFHRSLPPGCLSLAQTGRQNLGMERMPGAAIAAPAALSSASTVTTTAAAPDVAGAPDVEFATAGAAVDHPADKIGVPGPAESQVWNMDERYVETAVLKLNVAMLRSAATVTEIDTRLRACQGNYDQETIHLCLEQLRKDCETYLLEQSQAAEEFHQRLDELGELSAMGEQIEMANFEQAAQIETTLSNLAHMDFGSDLKQAGDRLLAEIDKLRAARHKLRDDQERAFLAIARQEGRLGQIEEQLKLDGLTKLPNRIGLEATLQQWCDEGWRQQELVLSLLDLDRFQAVNEEHGCQAGDRVVYHMAQYLLGEAGEGNLVCRFAGQQFLMVTVNLGPRTVTKNVEMIRQSVERMTFTRGDKSFHLTVSAAITPLQSADTPERLFARLQQALSHAKQSGRNRSCFQDGLDTHPIESPNMGAEYRDILV